MVDLDFSGGVRMFFFGIFNRIFREGASQSGKWKRFKIKILAKWDNISPTWNFFEIRDFFPFSYQPFLSEGPDNLTRKNVCRILECIYTV